MCVFWFPASAFNGRPDPEAFDTPGIGGWDRVSKPGCLKALNQSGASGLPRASGERIHWVGDGRFTTFEKQAVFFHQSWGLRTLCSGGWGGGLEQRST